MVKAVFFDIDGTLLSQQTNRVPDSARRALEELRRRGILTFIATGRHVSMLRQMQPLEGLRFDGIISLNGQYCYNDDGILYHCPFSREAITGLLDYLKENPHPCILVEEEQMFLNFRNELVDKINAAIHVKTPPLGDLDRGFHVPIYQAILYMTDENLKKLPPLPGIRPTYWGMGADLIPADGGKAAGIARILEHYGIDRSETMAFGDAENDVDMFQTVAISVAMGNARPEAKAAADYITDDVDSDGIWNALKHFGIL